MTALAHVANWLLCPHCRGAVELRERSVVCAAAHSFDVAKQGYVNLLGHGAPKNADTADMIAARDRFLSAGHYSPISDAVAEAADGAHRMLEVGAGTGHYLAKAMGPDGWGLATDVSVPAIRRAAKVHPRVAAVVADTWAGLPLVDDAVDALLCVFAPRNLDEFRRIVRPGGQLIFVVPNSCHMQELREEHGLLSVAEHKAQQLVKEFPNARARRVHFRLDLDGQSATDLVGMGPNAHHGQHSLPGAQVSVDVTVVTASNE